MAELTTTLNRIRKQSPCEPGWAKLLAGLGKTKADDEELPFSKILEINGLENTLWCTRVEPQHNRLWRLYAVWCARQVQHLMTDPRSINALNVAERFANGNASDDELREACIAAGNASDDELREACIGAGDAAWAAAYAAPDAVAYAAASASSAAGFAAFSALQTAQGKKFLEIVTTGDWS